MGGVGFSDYFAGTGGLRLATPVEEQMKVKFRLMTHKFRLMTRTGPEKSEVQLNDFTVELKISPV